MVKYCGFDVLGYYFGVNFVLGYRCLVVLDFFEVGN